MPSSEEEPLDALRRSQKELAPRVVVPAEGPAPTERVLGLDVQYEGDLAHVAASWHQPGGAPVTYVGTLTIEVGYVPTYFCFREGPPLLALVEALRSRGVEPELLIVDGHGIAHPRRFGVASWLGLATGLPTIGCAKHTLLCWAGELGEPAGSFLPVYRNEEEVGAVLRTRDGVKPVFVSPGHLVSVPAARDLILGLPGPYRVPDPIREADQAARAHTRGEDEVDRLDLGTLRPATPRW